MIVMFGERRDFSSKQGKAERVGNKPNVDHVSTSNVIIIVHSLTIRSYLPESLQLHLAIRNDGNYG